ncbi:MAG: DUF475 domain-containing protein [Bdellovibrionaceae bacterium]|nr:DUF475 domain-containing protein [Pseudobdellovibrionaceae bacterium]
MSTAPNSLAHKSYLSFFTGSFIISALGLVLAGFLGWLEHQTVGHALQFVFLCFVLSLLEVSISFDNAVVNATVLRKMTPIWQRRFLTWGILIAVFGMRLVFPLLIVCISAAVGPIEALKIATFEPQRYADMMMAVHHEVAAYGGSFLALVALKYFFDSSKEVHWIRVIEEPLAKWGRVDVIEVGIVLVGLWVLSKTLPPTEGFAVLQAGVAGIITFVGVEALGEMLQSPEGDNIDPHKASLGMFLYLEVLDASFSFDGVIGAFAITNHLFLIAIGLGIGALFVRSLTIMMVEKGALDAFVYLEHGAFWAVGALATIMFLGIHFHIPEVITGLIGIAFIGLAIWSSFRLAKRNQEQA